jgi:hypothetical protein
VKVSDDSSAKINQLVDLFLTSGEELRDLSKKRID